MARKWCVFFCFLLTHLNRCIGNIQIPRYSVVTDPDCSMWIFNVHREEATIFLDPDATKDDLNHAKESIRSQYSNADQKKISKCFEKVYNKCNAYISINSTIIIYLGFNPAVSNTYDWFLSLWSFRSKCLESCCTIGLWYFWCDRQHSAYHYLLPERSPDQI